MALAGWWWAKRDGTNARPWAYAIVIIAMLTAACEVTQWAVVTDREQIRSQLDRACLAVDNADVDTLLSLTDESLVAEGRTQKQFARWLEGTLQRTKIRSASIQRLDVQFPSRDVAEAMVTGIATVESSVYGGIVSGTWKIVFSRIDGRWKIVSLQEAPRTQRFP